METKVAIPRRMAHLDRDKRGYPIPFVVLRDSDGRPHFTINDDVKMRCVIDRRACAICGSALVPTGMWFVGGALSALHPMGSYFDPPLHRPCAHYALQACPYLAAPSYSGRVDARTLKEEVGLLVDHTMMPHRPSVFVAIKVKGFELSRSGLATHFHPLRPYLDIQFWHHGVRLASDDGWKRATAEMVKYERGDKLGE